MEYSNTLNLIEIELNINRTINFNPYISIINFYINNKDVFINE